MKVDYRMQYYDVITNPRWRTHYGESLRRYISVKIDQIMMKFGRLKQILTSITNAMTKIQIFKFKMVEGRRIIGKHRIGHNSVADCAILANFLGREQQALMTVERENHKLSKSKQRSRSQPPS